MKNVSRLTKTRSQSQAGLMQSRSRIRHTPLRYQVLVRGGYVTRPIREALIGVLRQVGVG